MAIVGILMVVMTAVVVMMAGVIVIARVDIFDLCDMLMCAVPMRLTRAGMMKTTPEYRVQQHCCDGKKFARGGHAGVFLGLKSYLLSAVYGKW
ncbi:hypothetical protein [Planctomycetes bacterium TBK1r]|uniref:hypothetical protein n=1 Tax=Stieleria magnilauensis TaxID=2527963 RepID=UPI0011A3BB4F